MSRTARFTTSHLQSAAAIARSKLKAPASAGRRARLASCSGASRPPEDPLPTSGYERPADVPCSAVVLELPPELRVPEPL
jgi:hypothetical protein